MYFNFTKRLRAVHVCGIYLTLLVYEEYGMFLMFWGKTYWGVRYGMY